MTRADMRTRVRDNVGEPTAGYWTDAEINRWIQDATDRHAREALSVQWTWRTSSVGGVREYRLPAEIQEVIDVRWVYSDTEYGMSTDSKASIRDGSSESDTTNIPLEFYVYGDILGLNYIPNLSATTEYSTETDKDSDEEFTAMASSLAQTFTLTAETQVHNARLYLRKTGNPPGAMQVGIYNVAATIPTVQVPNGLSQAENIAGTGGMENWYEWVVFNWQIPPVLAAGTYALVPVLSAAYQAAYVASTTSLTWGSDQSSPTYTTGNAARDAGAGWVADTTTDFLFEVHPLRNDIYVEAYRSVTNVMSADTDSPDVPDRYHEDIINLVTARCFRKDGYDLALAQYYEALALRGTSGLGGIMAARADGMRESRARPSGGTTYRSRHAEGTSQILSP